VQAIREYEVLIALCKAAPQIQTGQSASRLARQLVPYLMDAHAQTFAASPFYRDVEPSPTEQLSYSVTAALLSLGTNHSEVQEMVADRLAGFLNSCGQAAQSAVPSPGHQGEDMRLEDALRIANVTVTLLGFLDAASAQADFWRSGGRLALVRRLREMLSEPFLIAVETSFSTIRNIQSSDRQVREWKRYLRHYSDIGRPLGAMLVQRSFMWLLVASTSLLVADLSALRRGTHILDMLMSGEGLHRPLSSKSGDVDFRSVETYANILLDQMNYLDSSADFIRLGSPFQQRLAFSIKASAIISYLCCSRLNEEAADSDVLMAWLEETLADSSSMADEELATAVLKSLALVCRITPSFAGSVSRLLPRFIVQSGARSNIVSVASQSLAYVLRMLSADAVITTLYTLGNVLSPGTDRTFATGLNGDFAHDPADASQVYAGRQSTGSSISLRMTGEEDTAAMHNNVIQAICEIAMACKDDKITGLAQSMLLQKFSKLGGIVDARIMTSAAALALSGGGQLEFRALLRFYVRMTHSAVVEGKQLLMDAITKARNYISLNLKKESPLHSIYWEHMLDSIVSQGDAHQHHHAKESDVELAAQEIAQWLQPLALFMSTNDMASDDVTDDDTHAMLRDAWFNIVVHGFTTRTERGRKHLDTLRVIAIHSPPLVLEQRSEGDEREDDIDLNTILRRGESSERESLQRKHLTEMVPSRADEIKGLSYRRTTFLQSAYMVEMLRAEAGDCTKVTSYFLETIMSRNDINRTMEGIMGAVMDKYLSKTKSAANATFSSQYAATQLAKILCVCCHRIDRVQQAAFACADRMIREIPSALCERSSLFALLELLSLMWKSCLESETDEYEPSSTFSSKRGNVTVELSDDYAFRKYTLDHLYRRAKIWVFGVINVAPSDIKGLLQTYLSEFDDDGAYGHISLGRSFAMEMGFSIPATDQRLSSLDKLGDCNINTASDFVAQYTTRQEYRYTEALPDHSLEWLSFMRLERRASFIQSSNQESADAVTALAHIERRIFEKRAIPLNDIKDILRRAAALLCRSQTDESGIVHYLVSLPFAIFSKESIKLGVSLWLGVMNENRRMEPRLLAEIAWQWERSIQRRLGLFNPALTDPDPFFLKEEYAPSDNAGVTKTRQRIHDLLAPHTRLLQFFASHYNATRLGNVDTQKIFLRTLNLTLEAIRTSSRHPMAREIHFQIVLFGLRVLRTSTTMSAVAQWSLKDKILSAGLRWFSAPPKWSFGSNVLQVKTEIRLLSDVLNALHANTSIGAHAVKSIPSLQSKEQLLMLLLENEQSRLSVWVYPLSEPHSSQTASRHSNKASVEGTLTPLVRVAWAEDPLLAIELTSRFPFPRIVQEVRSLLLKFPAKVISYPDALTVLLDGSLPADVSYQLKVRSGQLSSN
jgi:phosphatidylinositol 4-kinase A